MRIATGLCLAVGITLTACSQQEDDQPARADRQASEEYGPPSVAPTAAPGVAFAYGYDYSLEDGLISKIQETHAAACEKLGVTQCRITGLRYQIDDQDQVSGMLQVKLNPRIARQFGKQATTTVEENDGKLVTAEFTGEDVGTQISTTQDRQADLQNRIAEIERRLASMNAGDREATQLQAQLDQLRRELAEAREQVTSGQQRLALTPMTFNYYGEGGIAGFDENPIKESWRLFVESGVTMISFLLKLIGVVLPWAILILLIVLLIRSRGGQAVRSWWRRIAPTSAEGEQ